MSSASDRRDTSICSRSFCPPILSILRSSAFAHVLLYSFGTARPLLSIVTSSISLAVSGARSVSGRGTTRARGETATFADLDYWFFLLDYCWHLWGQDHFQW